MRKLGVACISRCKNGCQNNLLIPAHPGGPGKRVVKRVCGGKSVRRIWFAQVKILYASRASRRVDAGHRYNFYSNLGILMLMHDNKIVQTIRKLAGGGSHYKQTNGPPL